MAKKPQYRLQTLFDIREKEKKAAEDVYAQKKRKVLEEEQTLKEMQDKHAEMIAMREAKKLEYAEKIREGGMKINEINANDRHIARLKEEEVAYLGEIDKQKEAVKLAEKAAQQAMDDMLEATKSFKALEKHKEKWQKEVKREQMLKEEDALEDVAQAQYFAQLKQKRSEEK